MIRCAVSQKKKHGTGRTTPLPVYVKTHQGSTETIIELMQIYQDDPGVTIDIIDNSHGKGGAVIVGPSILEKTDWDFVKIKAKEILEKMQDEGAISEEIYNGLSQEARPEPRIRRINAAFLPSKQKISDRMRLNQLSTRPFNGCTR